MQAKKSTSSMKSHEPKGKQGISRDKEEHGHAVSTQQSNRSTEQKEQNQVTMVTLLREKAKHFGNVKGSWAPREPYHSRQAFKPTSVHNWLHYGNLATP